MPQLYALKVDAGEHDRQWCPVSAVLPAVCIENGGIGLRDRQSGKIIPAQASPLRDGVALTWLVNGLKAGESQQLIVEWTKTPVKPVVELLSDDREKQVKVLVSGQLFTAYHYGAEWVRPFCHPLIGPGNVHVTRDWPVLKNTPGEHRDHPHHKSLWVAYGECGKVDNWSEEPGHGWQIHQRFEALESGPVFGRLQALNHWCYPNGRKQFEESRELCFYALPEGARLLDLHVNFRMTEGPVIFRDTKEGGLISVRVASSMDVRNGGRIENGYGGINEQETWGQPAPWCDYSGLVKGESVGIAILDHKDNPRYPTGWHVRDYGLMTANCFAWKYYRPDAKIKGDMAFKKGQKTSWRYRLYIHKGNARQGKVAQRFHDFIAPPRVTVV